MLDMQQITMNTLDKSAPDGMHYENYVCNAAASVMLLASQPAVSTNHDCQSRCKLGAQ